jgi:hypothetical protein
MTPNREGYGIPLGLNQEHSTQVNSKDDTAKAQHREDANKAQDMVSTTLDDGNTTDHAQQIWRRMRQISRGSKENGTDSSEGNGEEEAGAGLSERMLEIQRQALRNKRSIGADTLRSLARSLGNHGRSTTSLDALDDDER